jgi:hypothetical protein
MVRFDREGDSLAKIERFLAECVQFRAGLRNGVRINDQQSAFIKTKLYELIYDVEVHKTPPDDLDIQNRLEEWMTG